MMRWEDLYVAPDVSGSNVRYGVPGSGEERSTVEPRLPAVKVQGTAGGALVPPTTSVQKSLVGIR